MTEPAGRLRGVRVLVTRPVAAAGRLADAVAAEGADAVCVPAIFIAPAGDEHSAERLRARLPDVSVAVFTSVNAVDGYFALMANDAGRRLPPAVLAVGRATANALHARGVTGVDLPSGRFDSEGLLGCAQLDGRRVSGRPVAIVKGEGGRGLLARELGRRGAEVIEANVYRRVAPHWLADTLDDVRESIDVVTATSAAALENLLDAAPWTARWLSGRMVVTVSERIADIARTRNLTQVEVACGADAASIVEATVRALVRFPDAGANRSDGRSGRKYSAR